MISFLHSHFAFWEAPPMRGVESSDKQNFVHVVIEQNGPHGGNSLLEFVETCVDVI